MLKLWSGIRRGRRELCAVVWEPTPRGERQRHMTILRHVGVAVFIIVLTASCSSTTTTRTQPSPATKTVTYRDKGATVTLHAGDHLKVLLDSTYWTIQPVSPRNVLRL